MKKLFFAIVAVLVMNTLSTSVLAIEVIDSQEDLYESIQNEKKNPFAQPSASFSKVAKKKVVSELSDIEKMNMEGKAILITDSNDSTSVETSIPEDEKLGGSYADELSEREDFVQEYDEDDSYEDRIKKSVV